MNWITFFDLASQAFYFVLENTPAFLFGLALGFYLYPLFVRVKEYKFICDKGKQLNEQEAAPYKPYYKKHDVEYVRIFRRDRFKTIRCRYLIQKGIFCKKYLCSYDNTPCKTALKLMQKVKKPSTHQDASDEK